MKRKCEACQGKGGWEKRIGLRRFVTLFVSCQQCQGRGRWYDNDDRKGRGDNKGKGRSQR